MGGVAQGHRQIARRWQYALLPEQGGIPDSSPSCLGGTATRSVVVEGHAVKVTIRHEGAACPSTTAFGGGPPLRDKLGEE